MFGGQEPEGVRAPGRSFTKGGRAAFPQKAEASPGAGQRADDNFGGGKGTPYQEQMKKDCGARGVPRRKAGKKWGPFVLNSLRDSRLQVGGREGRHRTPENSTITRNSSMKQNTALGYFSLPWPPQ